MKRTWTSEELLEHFTLLPGELTAVGNKSGPTRLGFAVLLKCLQYEGRFPRSRQEVAPEVVRFLSTQVGVDATLFAQYAWEGRTNEIHRAQIRELAKIREFRRPDEEALLDWLCSEILAREQHPERLRELIRAECRTRAIEAPDDIAALIETGLAAYEAQIYTVIVARLTPEVQERLDALLVSQPVVEGEEGEGPLLAGAAQAVPAALLPTASPPPQLPARRLPLPATASLRCGLPAPDHRCQGRAGGGREWGGPARLGLDSGGRLGLPAREGAPSQAGGQSVYIKSEIGFAFSHLLGFRLLPRLKPIHSQKLAIVGASDQANYPHLKEALGKPINWELIRQQYDQMIKYATALRIGTADADAILQRFTRSNLQHPTDQGLHELGRVIKTIFLCEYLSSQQLRREIQEALNVIEQWNSVNGFIFHGKGGELLSNRPEDQEIAVLSLHLIQVSLALINTLML